MAEAEMIACIEVWYNVRVRSWVVQRFNNDGDAFMSDYVYTLDEALSMANSFNVPVVRTTPDGQRYQKSCKADKR